MLLVIMASLRNHECLTKEQIREYVQRHAVSTQVDPATAAAEAMETTETAAEAELEVEAKVGPVDSLGAQPVGSVEAMELEPTEAAAAAEAAELETTEAAAAAEAMETTEAAAEAELEIEAVVGPVDSLGAQPVDSLEARHVEAMKALARNATTGEALTGAASGGYALLAFALAMLAMAGLGCSLCVVATSCCLARAERALREGVRGVKEG